MEVGGIEPHTQIVNFDFSAFSVPVATISFPTCGSISDMISG